MIRKSVFLLLHVFVVILLTIVTQVGGIVWLASLLVHRFIPLSIRLKQFLTFLLLYFSTSFLLLPLIAPIFGREVIKETAHLKAASILTSICNRNYVVPRLNETLSEIEKDVVKEGITVLFLDANFPFLNGFPLLPHLSHNDGKKIDLSFVYEHAAKGYSDKQKSRSGYGVFEAPSKGEVNQIKNCIRLGYWQYDLTKWLTFGKVNGDLNFSNKGTKKLVTSLVKNNRVEKVFLEPHLVNRLKLKSGKIRYHGCRAVRHDDHIHFQVY